MLVINMNEMNAKKDFYTASPLALESGFDPEFMKKDKQDFKKLLKPEEDVDRDGNKGNFLIGKNFGLQFVCNISDEVMDDEVVTDVMANIPHIEKWKKYYVTK